MSIEFLLENAGPYIKYRTLTELISEKDNHSIDDYKKILLGERETEKIISFIKSQEKINDFNGIHGSTEHHLENSLMMAIDRGLDCSFEPIRNAIESIIPRLRNPVFNETHSFYRFPDIIINPLLYLSGIEEKWILEHIDRRIEHIYSYTKTFDYNIYESRSSYNLPKCFGHRRLIKESLYANGEFSFPLIHDLYAFSKRIKNCSDTNRKKIEDIIRYTLHESYFKLDRGYGILRNGKGRYLAMGWDCKLPQVNENLTPLILRRMELMSNFTIGISTEWFQKSMQLIERYSTERGTWLFPNEALKDNKSFWVAGNRMSFGENRRKKIYLETESTFITHKILKNIERAK